MVPIGDALRRARLARKLSQAEVAHAAGLRQASVSQIEAGSDALISSIVRVARAVGVEISVGERVVADFEDARRRKTVGQLRRLRSVRTGPENVRRASPFRGEGVGGGVRVVSIPAWRRDLW